MPIDQEASDAGGPEVNLPFSMGMVWAILCGDLLTYLEYMARPYEIKFEQTDEVLRQSIEYLYEVFRKGPYAKRHGVRRPGIS